MCEPNIVRPPPFRPYTYHEMPSKSPYSCRSRNPLDHFPLSSTPSSTSHPQSPAFAFTLRLPASPPPAAFFRFSFSFRTLSCSTKSFRMDSNPSFRRVSNMTSSVLMVVRPACAAKDSRSCAAVPRSVVSCCTTLATPS